MTERQAEPNGAPPKPRARKPRKPKAAPQTAAATATAAPPAAAPLSAPAAETPALQQVLMSQSPDTVAALSRNLAEAMARANNVFATSFLDAQQGANMPWRPDPFNVQGALSEVWTSLASHPETLREAHADLWRRYMEVWQRYAERVMTGQAGGDAALKDKRFKDPEWSANPAFALLRDTYLTTADFLNTLVSRADVDDAAKQKAAFFIKQAVDAASPSNFLLTNPAALRALVQTRGESLVKGMENFAEDLKRGKGQLAITQTDADAFKLGVNVAATPGKVIFRNALIEILQYEPTTAETLKTPLLIFPPWINKFYIMDLQPKNSMIKWLTDQGLSVFLASWINPDAAMADKTFEDYMRDGILAGLQAVQDATGEEKINTVGYCIGGTLLAATLGAMAAKGDDRVNSATFFASQSDFQFAGELKVFTDDAGIQYLEDRVEAQGGVLDAQAMADTFNSLRSNDLIWSYVVDNYYLGKKPPPFDLLYWNSDQTRMPRALHMFYLKRFYRDNAMARGELTLLGEKIDLKRVKTPIFMQSSREDHIAPAKSVYASAQLFGGPVQFLMAGSGHIAGVINPPGANKYQHWVNEKLPATLDQWLADAEEHPGSWWPHWRKWMGKISGPMVPARKPGDGGLKVLGDAPGEYVKIRSAA
ncbi:MAG: class I poly(R)-hydroxyalkanoic acid synthase [Alphaproteobacteria bacterium]|nr:class I poly(R)-hydroxyalkanoic acid synthase [Alphaproteobacteria bacterium]